MTAELCTSTGATWCRLRADGASAIVSGGAQRFRPTLRSQNPGCFHERPAAGLWAVAGEVEPGRRRPDGAPRRSPCSPPGFPSPVTTPCSDAIALRLPVTYFVMRDLLSVCSSSGGPAARSISARLFVGGTAAIRTGASTTMPFSSALPARASTSLPQHRQRLRQPTCRPRRKQELPSSALGVDAAGARRRSVSLFSDGGRLCLADAAETVGPVPSAARPRGLSLPTMAAWADVAGVVVASGLGGPFLRSCAPALNLPQLYLHEMPPGTVGPVPADSSNRARALPRVLGFHRPYAPRRQHFAQHRRNSTLRRSLPTTGQPEVTDFVSVSAAGPSLAVSPNIRQRCAEAPGIPPSVATNALERHRRSASGPVFSATAAVRSLEVEPGSHACLVSSRPRTAVYVTADSQS